MGAMTHDCNCHNNDDDEDTGMTYEKDMGVESIMNTMRMTSSFLLIGCYILYCMDGKGVTTIYHNVINARTGPPNRMPLLFEFFTGSDAVSKNIYCLW
jgi:hypothetical protein